MEFHEPFPKHRRLDPLRQAEARVYDEITASAVLGYALYEFQYGNLPELDLVVWPVGGSRCTMQIKGRTLQVREGPLVSPRAEWGLEGKALPAQPDLGRQHGLRQGGAGGNGSQGARGARAHLP